MTTERLTTRVELESFPIYSKLSEITLADIVNTLVSLICKYPDVELILSERCDDWQVCYNHTETDEEYNKRQIKERDAQLAEEVRYQEAVIQASLRQKQAQDAHKQYILDEMVRLGLTNTQTEDE